MQTVLKAVRKINRKKLKHARHQDIVANKFEGLAGPIDTQHLLISTLLLSSYADHHLPTA